MADQEHASAGHKLGQLVGDWFEEFFVMSLLRRVADHLNLYLDCRFCPRQARRGDKIIWTDFEGNLVDYDFVMELDATDNKLGIPVAFFECFWRRGKRHSKDKARDDTGKFSPMRDVHPTARFLGIVAGGDFTAPARALVQNRQIDLFYVPKTKIVSAFERSGLQIDYPDRLAEPDKAKLADAFAAGLTLTKKTETAETLRELIGEVSLNTYVDRVRAALGALPQEIRIIAQHESKPEVFETIADATDFLKAPKFDYTAVVENFIYEITYTDGTEFERMLDTIGEVKTLHREIERLALHMSSLNA
ncbi:MAG TPA: hypothetical protein VHZ24_12230 [Pirellulales bacterium]|jgi:hypothetical protein|nr:hypothetical protein [Pirellulales bacterium]